MYSMPAHLGLIWRHKIDRLGLIREEQNRAAGDNKRRHEMDEVRNNLEKIRILADSREWPGSDIRRVLEMLKEKDLLGGYEKELDTAVYRNIFRIWKLAYERKSAPCYEGKLDFVEARILEFYRNEQNLSRECADEVLEYIRVIGAGLVTNGGKPADTADEKPAAAAEATEETEESETKAPEPCKGREANNSRCICSRKFVIFLVSAAAAAVFGVVIAESFRKRSGNRGKEDGKNQSCKRISADRNNAGHSGWISEK